MDVENLSKRTTMLVLRAQAGDRDAADRLLRMYQKDLYEYLLGMLRHSSDAEDALQMTFWQTVKKIRWLRDPALVRTWMFRIASRNALAILKRRRQGREQSNVDFIDCVAHPEKDPPDHEQWIEQIPQWLERLTPIGREAVILHYLKGFTTEDVAEILGVPLGTAKSRISYSLACIRRQIEHTQ